MTVFARPFGPVFSQTMFDTQLAAFRPSFSVDFLREELPDNFTFTRASSATDGSSGTLLTFGNNAYRRSDQKGLLLEGARTNLAIRSNEFTNTGGWGTVSATVNQLSGTSIGLNRFEVVSSGGTFNRTESAGGAALSLTSGAVYSLTLFFETTGTSGRLRAQVRNNTGATESRITGVIGSLAAATSDAGTWSNVVETVVSGNVRRLTAQFTPNFTGTDARLGFGPDSAVAGQTCVILAAQFELGAFASSYIPTTGTAATRAADSVIEDMLASIGFNPLEGTMVAEFETMGQNPSAQIYLFGSDGFNAINVRRGFGSPDQLIAFSTVSAVNQAGLTFSGVGNFAVQKHAFAWKQDDFAASLNGSAPLTDTLGTLPTVSALRLGCATVAGQELFGWLRRLTYWPARLSNAQLPVISTL